MLSLISLISPVKVINWHFCYSYHHLPLDFTDILIQFSDVFSYSLCTLCLQERQPTHSGKDREIVQVQYKILSQATANHTIEAFYLGIPYSRKYWQPLNFKWKIIANRTIEAFYLGITLSWFIDCSCSGGV